jgi:hypothetical protein
MSRNLEGKVHNFCEPLFDKMDFARFTFKKNYHGREVLLDFVLKAHTGHSGKSFTGYSSIKTFLEENPDRIIYLTLDQTPDFYEEGVKIVVNLRSYQVFWRTIAQNSRNRFQALKTYAH